MAASKQTDAFRVLLALGIVTIFALQIFIIIGGTLNLIPLTGITLPFISYGGTSIIVSFVMVGLLLRLSASPGGVPPHRDMPHSIGHIQQVYTLGFLTLFIGLFYSVLWLGPQLNEQYRVIDGYVDNVVTYQRQTAWLGRVTRGDIVARDGTLLAWADEAGRHVTDLSLAHVIGQVDDYGLGLSGLEAAYNQTLLGQDRYDPNTLLARQFSGIWGGNTLKLTIDPLWQGAADAALGDYEGAVVILDAHSGAVLAMTSHPVYDPTNIEAWHNIPGAPMFNRATEGLYPPGSTFKTVIAALALDRGLVEADTVFDFREDEWFWRGRNLCHQHLIADYPFLSCNSTLQVMTLTEGYAWSDNIMFATLAQELGPERLIAGAQLFGFGDVAAIDFDLPLTPARLSNNLQTLQQPTRLAMSGFGQAEVVATPLQMALVAATIANEGYTPRPYLVHQTITPDGHILQTTRPQTGRWVLWGGTASTMREIMIDAVENGSGSGAKISGLTVGGKTGTAEWAGSLNGDLPHAWFIAFADMPDGHTVALAILVEAAGEGGHVAAPMAGEILQRMRETTNETTDETTNEGNNE